MRERVSEAYEKGGSINGFPTDCVTAPPTMWRNIAMRVKRRNLPATASPRIVRMRTTRSWFHRSAEKFFRIAPPEQELVLGIYQDRVPEPLRAELSNMNGNGVVEKSVPIFEKNSYDFMIVN
jgi:hypothetical protein